MTVLDRTEALRLVHEDVLNLSSSPLYADRVEQQLLPVTGEGSPEASMMFVGEAPGRNEARTGKPFCGASGRVLNQLLASINVNRANVYVTNIVKDRPPENRDPTPEEISLYGPFLDRQIDIIRPRVIATLGRFSMQYLFEHFGLRDRLAPISQQHGRVFEVTAGHGPVVLIPLYHPAVGIYNRHKLPELMNDFQVLKTYATL